MSLDLNVTRRVYEDRIRRIQFSWRENHSFENKVFIYQTTQFEKTQKRGDSKILSALASLVLCMTFSFMMGKTLKSKMMENLVIYRNVPKLLQSYAMILLVTKIIKCSLITSSQSCISYITLDWKEYMLLVQFDWTVCEVVLLMQTKISWKMSEALWITVVIAILE